MAIECIFISKSSTTEVLLRDSNNNFPNLESVDQNLIFGGYAIGEFTKGGTGFVVKKEIGKILIATAAQVFFRDFIFYNNPKTFKLGNSCYDANPLKQQFDWTSESNFYKDPITGIRISVPEDFILCEIQIVGNENIVALDIEMDSAVSAGNRVQVIGFPSIGNLDILRCAPSVTFGEKNELSRKLASINGIVKFEGIVEESEDLICATCSSLNGMLGSPLFKEVNGRLKVVGMLHGSRPSLIHFYSARFLNCINSPDFSMINELISVLEQKLVNIRDPFLRDDIDQTIRHVKFILENQIYKYKLESIVSDIYYDANVIEEESGNGVRYNVFIPMKILKQFLI